MAANHALTDPSMDIPYEDPQRSANDNVAYMNGFHVPNSHISIKPSQNEVSSSHFTKPNQAPFSSNNKLTSRRKSYGSTNPTPLSGYAHSSSHASYSNHAPSPGEGLFQSARSVPADIITEEDEPGLFISDTEEGFRTSRTNQSSGRKSAPLAAKPVFSKRAFGSQYFWNEGQTSIRKNITKEKQKRKALLRSQSTDPSDYNRISSGIVGHRGDQYGSSDHVGGFHDDVMFRRQDSADDSDIFSDESEAITATGVPDDRRGYYSDIGPSYQQMNGTSRNRTLDSKHQRHPNNASASRNSLNSDAALNPLFSDESRTLDASEVNVRSSKFSGTRVFSSQGRRSKSSLGQGEGHVYGDDRHPEVLGALPYPDSVVPYSGEKQRLIKGNDDNDDDDDATKTSSSKSYEKESKTQVYHRRWYILFLFSVSALIWNAVWSTWGPIAQSAKLVYDWSDGDIAMFTWLGNAPFLVTMFPLAYLMDVKGMRISMVLCCGLTFLGASLRCVPAEPVVATWLINSGQLLNGVAGIVPMAGPAVVSGLWFPNNERATATAISTIAGYLGACCSFVIGPMLVPEPNLEHIYGYSSSYLKDKPYFSAGNTTDNATDISEQKDGIQQILYGEAGLSGLLFLAVIIYFPSKPPRPPSVSAGIPREDYLDGIKMLVRNKQFWVTAIAYSVPVGVYEVWQVVLDVNLNPRVTQETAGWLDTYATLGGCASGLLVSRFADFFTRQMKLCLLLFYCGAAVASLWFAIMVGDILPFDTASIYVASILLGVFLDGGAPLFFELVIEVSYPVGEGVTSGFLQLLTAGSGLAFLSVLQDESVGKSWMNWAFFGCVAMAIPLLFCIDNNALGRADIDDMEVDVSDDEEEEGITSITGNDREERRTLLNSTTI